MININNISAYLRFVILIFIVMLTIQPPVDLDLGWHLRYGEHFFKTGSVLKDNITSFVWPNYQWVQASWGYDLLLYQIFSHFGFFGVSLCASIFTLLTFIIITYPLKRFTFWQYLFLATTFLFLTSPMYITGLRSQTPSTLFFALVLLIADNALKKETKFLFLLPAIFFVWSNMHGGFALGLILLFIMWIIQGFLLLLRRKPVKTWLIFGVTLTLSVLTPLINPWGVRIYEETLKHSSNINLTGVAEWQPLFKVSLESALTILIVTFLAIVAYLRRKSLDIPYMVALVVALYLAFSAFRFLIIFGVMAVYFLSKNIPLVNWKQFVPQKFNWATKIIFVILIISDIFVFKYYFLLVNPKIVNFSWSSYCQTQRDCSEEISALMLAEPPKGNGYNHYNYGGYLSWRVPLIKTFLDGRMAAWEKDSQTPPLELGDQVLAAANPIPFIKLDNEYHFNWAIIPTTSPIVKYLDSLTEAGIWKKMYADKYFSYYSR